MKRKKMKEINKKIKFALDVLESDVNSKGYEIVTRVKLSTNSHNKYIVKIKIEKEDLEI